MCVQTYPQPIQGLSVWQIMLPMLTLQCSMLTFMCCTAIVSNFLHCNIETLHKMAQVGVLTYDPILLTY